MRTSWKRRKPLEHFKCFTSSKLPQVASAQTLQPDSHPKATASPLILCHALDSWLKCDELRRPENQRKRKDQHSTTLRSNATSGAPLLQCASHLASRLAALQAQQRFIQRINPQLPANASSSLASEQQRANRIRACTRSNWGESEETRSSASPRELPSFVLRQLIKRFCGLLSRLCRCSKNRRQVLRLNSTEPKSVD